MELTHDNATHLLRCAHAIGRSRREYTMRCHVLKVMPDHARFKILVFGDREWANSENLSRIRYVSRYKVSKRVIRGKYHEG